MRIENEEEEARLPAQPSDAASNGAVARDGSSAAAAVGSRPTGPPSGPMGGAGRGPAGFRDALDVLRHREFAIFWVGQLVSLVGTWMQGYAQGLVVVNLAKTAMALGLVNFASSIPTLLLMPVGGVAADRYDRRSILIVTQLAQLILAAAMGVLVLTNRLQLWHVYVIALLLGVATAYDLPAYQAFYPQLVEKEDLSSAISLNQASFHGARVIGPAIASFIVWLWSMAAAFFANAVSFLAVMASLFAIKPRPPVGGHPPSPLSMMREGVRYVRERPDIQALLGMTAMTTLFLFPNIAVLSPFYVKWVLHADERALGVFMSASGIGAFIGATLLLSVPREQRVSRMMLSVGLLLVTMSTMAWSRWVWLSVIAVGIQSVGISQLMGLSSIIVQELVTNEVRGRVMSLYSLAFTGIMPFAALLISFASDQIGMRNELQIAAVLYVSSALYFLSRLRRIREPAVEVA